MVAVIDGGLLRVVDVVHHDVAFLARDDALTVVGTAGSELHHGHVAVGVAEGDALLDVHAVVVLHAVRLNVLDVGAEYHSGKVDGIDADVEQGASAQLGLGDAFLVGDGIAQVGRQHVRAADGTVEHQLADGVGEGHVACPDGFGDEHVAFLGQLQQCFGLAGVGREGLFAEHGLPVEDAQAGMLVVVGVGRGDVDQVDVRVGGQFFIRSAGFLEAPLLGEGFGTDLFA